VGTITRDTGACRRGKAHAALRKRLTLVLDSGALIALERGHPQISALIKIELKAGRQPLTHGGVIGQVWRSGSGRQVNLAKVLGAIDVVPLDDRLGRRAGVLLGQTRMRDVIDAALVLLAEDGDFVLTSDPDDLAPLALAAGLQVDVVSV
jgi:hypothetical protein